MGIESLKLVLPLLSLATHGHPHFSPMGEIFRIIYVHREFIDEIGITARLGKVSLPLGGHVKRAKELKTLRRTRFMTTILDGDVKLTNVYFLYVSTSFWGHLNFLLVSVPHVHGDSLVGEVLITTRWVE